MKTKVWVTCHCHNHLFQSVRGGALISCRDTITEVAVNIAAASHIILPGKRREIIDWYLQWLISCWMDKPATGKSFLHAVVTFINFFHFFRFRFVCHLSNKNYNEIQVEPTPHQCKSFHVYELQQGQGKRLMNAGIRFISASLFRQAISLLSSCSSVLVLELGLIATSTLKARVLV